MGRGQVCGPKRIRQDRSGVDAAWRHSLLQGCVPMGVTHCSAAMSRYVSSLTRPGSWGWLLLPSEAPLRMGDGLGERQAADRGWVT